jgi:hypothetical protein
MSEPSSTIRNCADRVGEGHDYAAFVVTFQTHADRTYVTARLARDVRPRGRNMDLGSVWISIGRGGLAGLTPRACLAVLCRQLWSDSGYADGEANPIGVASGVPLGATGGTVTNIPLPGL